MTVLLSGSIIAVATRNRGKLAEFEHLLRPRFAQVLGLDEIGFAGDIEERGSTFPENARHKALACSRAAQLPVLADDSGLEVFGLGGRPGIYSARYAGPEATDNDRIRRLLQELDASGASREARFVCALALARAGRVLIEAEGECRGLIAPEPRGSQGFGYDPVFLFPELGRTYAELSPEEKNLHSHRARAVAALLRQIEPPGSRLGE